MTRRSRSDRGGVGTVLRRTEDLCGQSWLVSMKGPRWGERTLRLTQQGAGDRHFTPASARPRRRNRPRWAALAPFAGTSAEAESPLPRKGSGMHGRGQSVQAQQGLRSVVCTSLRRKRVGGQSVHELGRQVPRPMRAARPRTTIASRQTARSRVDTKTDASKRGGCNKVCTAPAHANTRPAAPGNRPLPAMPTNRMAARPTSIATRSIAAPAIRTARP